ncbi:hypothetical protein ACQEU8_16710 [Streptomyces sp. CA-250714]|uniref:hypothetical protein n=1 Tax=Streptomyces sp. CA-250714 TaxID=3240060 RepID=UPI003D9200D5
MPETDHVSGFPTRLEELSAVQRMALEEDCPWDKLMQETPPTLRGDDQHLHHLWRAAMAARNRGGSLVADNARMEHEARERTEAQHAWRVGAERYRAERRSGRPYLNQEAYYENLGIVKAVCSNAEDLASQVLEWNGDLNAVLQDRLEAAHVKASFSREFAPGAAAAHLPAFAPGAAAEHLPSGAASRSGGDSVTSSYRGRPGVSNPNSPSRRSPSRGRG